jgi:Cytochrome c554 and c-prime
VWCERACGRALLVWMALAGCESGGDGAGSGGEAEPGPSALAGFGDPADCAECHRRHAADWEISSHAYAIVDPVFRAMVKLGQQDTEGELGNFCLRCHSPIADETGQAPVVRGKDGSFTQDLDSLDRIARQGVSCDACHTATEVHATANAEYTLTPDGTRRAGIDDPMANDFHASEPSGLVPVSEFCGTCHQVVSELYTESFVLEDTFGEWLGSRFNNGTQHCQKCHMPTYEGQAAVGGPMRTVHAHTFVGVDVPLVEPDAFPGYDRMRELVTALLQESANLSASFDASTATLNVDIENLAGHRLPSGATADREMWLELIVRDADGEVVFESGTPDARGDLRDDDAHHTLEPGTDPELAVYRQTMTFDPALEDASSTEPARNVDFLWEPNTETSVLVATGGHSRPSYALSALPPGAYQASLRLLFRSFPPHLLRLLEERAGLDPEVKQRVPVVEMERLQLDFTR